MKIKNCKIPGVKLIYNDVYSDDRGKFIESYKESSYSKFGIDYRFMQDILVYSDKNVLSVLLYQEKFPQGKLVSAIEGEIFDVVIDINKNSTTFSQWFGVKLSRTNCLQLFIPPGYAHGYCVLSDSAIVMYKCTTEYNQNNQKGIIWSDNQIDIKWPISNPIISEKDSKLPNLSDL